MFKNLNSQAALGKGINGVSKLNATGLLDKAGMYYGKAEASSIKLFGIENVYGNGRTFLPGIYVDGSYAVYALDPTTNVEYAYSGSTSTYPLVYQAPKGITGHYPKRVYGQSEIGFIIVETGGSATTYFCDKLYVGMLQRSYMSMGNSSDTEIGMFALTKGENTNRTDTVGRSVYYKKGVSNES